MFDRSDLSQWTRLLISDACTIGYSYIHGYVARNIVDGCQSIPYLVVIGDDYAFAP
jgi:hypothetical protein